MNKSKKVFRLSILIIALALTITGISFVYSKLVENMMESDTNVLLNEISAQGKAILREKINSDFEKLHILADFLSDKTDVMDEGFLEYLKNAASNNDEILRYGICNKAGDIITSDGLEGNIVYTDTFKQAIKGEDFISNPMDTYLGEQDMVIHLAVPITREGEIRGVLSCVYTIEAYERLTSYDLFDGSGYIYVIKQNGEAIFRAKKSGNREFFKFGVNFKNNAEFQEVKGLSKMPENMKLQKTGTIKYYIQGEGRKYLCYTPMGIKDWYLISVVPSYIASAKMTEIQIMNVFIFASTLLIVMIFVWYIFRNKKKKRLQLEHIAYTDELTGLPNEEKLKDFYGKIFDLNNWSAVFININKFRVLNNMFSYEAGNQMLKDIAVCLDKYVGKDGLACHISGDAFVMLLPRIEEKALEKNINILLKEMEKINVKEGGNEYSYNCEFTCGIYQLTDADKNIRKVIDVVRIAIVMLKKTQKTTCITFTSEVKAKLHLKNELAIQVKDAMLRREFVPYYQPKYDMNNHEIMGAEMLSRWNHPKKGLLMPDTFISILEGEGDIIELDMYMLEEACKKIRKWIDEEMMPVPLSVNISKLNIHKENFVERVMSIVKKYEVPTVLIELEMTETAVFENEDKLIDIAKKLKGYGFLISLDDFGSGYSSLNLLRNLPIDIIKLDKNFLNRGSLTKHEQVIIKNIIKMAHELNMKVIAEGVESKEQEKMLKNAGCNYAQGYLYSKPISNDEFEKMIF